MKTQEQHDLPSKVGAALERAERIGFGLSCEPMVGQLLATLAAGVPNQGRILELGTGVGVGLAWLLHGLGTRTDVEVTSVEIDSAVSTLAAEAGWPSHVQLLVSDAVKLLPSLGEFDLIFADAQGGKWNGLDLTINALHPGGILLVDDMDLTRYPDPHDRAVVSGVRNTLVNHDDLVTVEIPAGSGIILATKRRSSAVR